MSVGQRTAPAAWRFLQLAVLASTHLSRRQKVGTSLRGFWRVAIYFVVGALTLLGMVYWALQQ